MRVIVRICPPPRGAVVTLFELRNKKGGGELEKAEKKCFACAELILEDAKRCKHCGTWQTDLDQAASGGFESPGGSRINDSKPKRRFKRKTVLLATLSLAAISGLSLAAFAFFQARSESAAMEAAARTEVSAFCGAVLKGAWRNVQLQDLLDAQMSYLLSGGGFANFRDIVLPELEPYESNAQLARELPYFKYKSVGGDLGTYISHFDSSRKDLQDAWTWLARPASGAGVAHFIVLPTLDEYSEGAASAILDEIKAKATVARDSMQYLQVECERFIASGN